MSIEGISATRPDLSILKGLCLTHQNLPFPPILYSIWTSKSALCCDGRCGVVRTLTCSGLARCELLPEVSRSNRRDPTSTMEVIAGRSSRPSDVNPYSTDGGEVARTLRSSTPRASRSRSLPVSTLAVIVGLSRRNSENRRGPLLRHQTSSGVQRPLSKAIHFDMGQPPGGGATFLRIFRLIVAFPWRFPDGYLHSGR